MKNAVIFDIKTPAGCRYAMSLQTAHTTTELMIPFRLVVNMVDPSLPLPVERVNAMDLDGAKKLYAELGKSIRKVENLQRKHRAQCTARAKERMRERQGAAS